MREINAEELLANSKLIPVDVRSAGEFSNGAIPGALNIPLFSDEERSEIGTLHKHAGSDAAKWRAMEIVSPKLPQILGQIREIRENGNEPVMYCWRGGMRSKAMATFLEFAGLSGVRLAGGYRAYRQYILEHIPALLPDTAIVLHGMTGAGKTEILKILKKKGYHVLDLEELAAHRGSIFGTLGMGDGHNQKTFDALLYRRLTEIKGTPYFFIEAESKRIGRAVQPDELISKKTAGIHLHIEVPFESRVDRIYEEYVAPYKNKDWFFPKVLDAVVKISNRVKDIKEREKLLEAMAVPNYRQIIRVLLESYYDPRYEHKRAEYPGEFRTIQAEDTMKAAEGIEKMLTVLKLAEPKIHFPC